MRRSFRKSRLPVSTAEDRANEPNLKRKAEFPGRTGECKCPIRPERCGQERNQQYRRQPRTQQPQNLARAGSRQIPNRGVFGVEMNYQRRNKPQPEAEKRPGEAKQGGRWSAIVDLRVQRQKTAAEKKRQRQTEEKKHALEIPLAAVTENHHHPEEWEQRSGSQQNEAEIEEQTH